MSRGVYSMRPRTVAKLPTWAGSSAVAGTAFARFRQCPASVIGRGEKKLLARKWWRYSSVLIPILHLKEVGHATCDSLGVPDRPCVGRRLRPNETKKFPARLPPRRARDNTAVNERDKADRVQKRRLTKNENQKDIDVTANIRKRVVDTKLSVNATNVKIITQDGKVTLSRSREIGRRKEANRNDCKRCGRCRQCR